jgi:hypothetical protein
MELLEIIYFKEAVIVLYKKINEKYLIKEEKS